MLVHHIHKALFATAISSLLPPAAAQNASSINRTECYGNMGSFDSNASVNSTGKVKFQFDNNDTNYYLSVTNNDSRSESTEFVKFIPEVRHDYQGWLSYPNDTTVLACIYELSAINASSPDGGMNGCEGVLSTACISELVKVRLPAGSDSNTRCPSFQATDSVKELCGGLTGRLFTINAKDLSNPNCSISSPQGISVPDDYLTQATIGFGAAPGDSDNYSTFDNYDLYVRQTVPWIISAATEIMPDGSWGPSNTQVVCVAPDTVLPGSRIPDLKFGTYEEENSATGGADWRVAGRLALVVAGTVSLGFVVY